MGIQKNAPCFDDKIEAWNFGPVVPTAYHEYKQYGSGDIPTIESYILFDTDNIWNTERVKFNDDVITVILTTTKVDRGFSFCLEQCSF